MCFSRAKITKFMSSGSNLIVKSKCSKGRISEWRSQPKIKNSMSAGSLLLSSAILFTGSTYTSIKKFMEVANIYFFSERTFMKLQTKVLSPSVNKVYKTARNKIIGTLSNCLVNVVGDGRCYSPGFNAKYGTYTLMNAQTNLILDFHIVQVSTVGNSSQMEKEGLKQLIEKFRKKEISISSLITDRHVQIRSYMKKEHPQIKHQFDVWHVAKNIKKKIVKKAKLKSCSELFDWVKVMVNHFWWRYGSCGGNAQELVVSILYHITNQHSWENCEIFKQCEHPDLSFSKQRKWL